jgi:hypothetical protein
MDVGVLPFSSGAYSNGPLYSATFVSFKLKPELLIRGRRFDSFLSIFLFKKKETFGGKYLERLFLLKLGQNWLRDSLAKLIFKSYRE